MKSSFNGDISEIPGIAVDNFEDTRKRAYFLSHCHADHVTGLQTLYDCIDIKSVFIYMSEISAAIVVNTIDERLKDCIKTLQIQNESTTITIPADEKNEIQEMYVGVTLIPAGHCFGSVMFLFETPLKKVLYTGDFRISENSVSKYGQLHDKDKKPIKLDVLYVDTTFQHMDYETFPKRSETIDLVVREIDRWLKQGEKNRVSLVPSARYGYEYVFNKIYKRMAMKVYVDSNWTLYSKFLDQLPGVTNTKSDTKIHLCSKSSRFCDCYKDKVHKYLYIHFSAMKWRNFNPEDLAMVSGLDGNVSICFATHCSRSELVYFVEYLAPKKVVGFSNPYAPLDEPTVVTPGRLKRSVEKKSDYESPKKVPKHILRKIFG